MERKRYAIRKSYFDAVSRRKNENQDLGYDYRDNLVQNSISKYILTGKNVGIINEINKLYVYLVDSVKNIKKTFHYAIERNSRNLN